MEQILSVSRRITLALENRRSETLFDGAPESQETGRWRGHVATVTNIKTVKRSDCKAVDGFFFGTLALKSLKLRCETLLCEFSEGQM